MKKHDEGYILAYVTVVLLVFCLVATAILTGALKNLQHQQDAIAQMKDEYVAEGLIERVVIDVRAHLNEAGEFEIREEDYIIKDAQNQDTVIASVDVSVVIISETEIYLEMVAHKGSATVTYTLKLDANSAENILVSAGDGTDTIGVSIDTLKDCTFVQNLPEEVSQ